jgi:hypothetical protein
MALDLVFGKIKRRYNREDNSSIGLDLWPTTYFKKYPPSHRMKTGILLAAGAAVFWFGLKRNDR